nr:RNA-dependent RNA polymerase [Rhizoctonia solani partitivirus A14]
MPVQSTIAGFQVLKNLRLLQIITEKKMVRFNKWDWDPNAKEKRDAFVLMKMRKHFDEDTVQKVFNNHRSIANDEAVIADFMSNEQPIHYIKRDEHYQRALRVVEQQMRPNRMLHPVAFPDLRAYPWKLSSSAERPWTKPGFTFVPFGENKFARDFDLETGKPRIAETQGKLRKFSQPINVSEYLRWKQRNGMTQDSGISMRNLYNEIFAYNRPLIHKIKDNDPQFWRDGKAIPHENLQVHLRTHVVPNDKPDKVRAVYGSPKLLIMSELMFIWPLQATYQNSDTGKLFWNREIAKGGWRKILREFHSAKANTYISMDWSGFDRRLLHELIRDVHTMWRGWFDFSSYEPTTEYPNPVTDAARIERLWDWMTQSIFRTPTLLPNNQLWEWTHNGFGSGFQQTQLMDTFCNMIMTYTVLSSLGINIEGDDFKSRFQGDDAILAFPEPEFLMHGRRFLSMMKEKAKMYFNAILSDDKSGIGDHPNDLYALGYNNEYGRPVRTEEDLLSHLMFPERPQDYGRLAASAAGLAHAALGCSERFHSLCEDIYLSVLQDETVKPNWKGLRWMQRAGMNEVLESLKGGEFPDYLSTLSAGLNPIEKTESELNRSWPTISNNVGGEVVFINKI